MVKLSRAMLVLAAVLLIATVANVYVALDSRATEDPQDEGVIQASGFTSTPNNARHVISGTPTSTKIVTTSSLTAEATSTGRTVAVQTLPLDVEQAAIETAKSYYQQRKTDSAVVEKQMGMARLRYSEQGGGAGDPGIPPRAAGLLRHWVRAI